MREILSLQFGDFANLIGARFWNTQNWIYRTFGDQRVDDLLPKETLFFDKSLTPRVICVGNALPLPSPPEDAPDIPAIPTWSGEVDVHFSNSTINSKYNWRSLSEVKYHERSLNLASLNQMYFPQQDEIIENIRYATEACDWLQGFQVSFDKSIEWGSLLSSTMSSIHDLYPKKPNINFLYPNPNPLDLHDQKVDDIVSLALAIEYSELIIPFSQNDQDEIQLAASLEAQMDPSFLYALLTDSCTLPLRMKHKDGFDLASLSAFYSKGRRCSTLLGVCGMLGSPIQLRKMTKTSWSSYSKWLSIPLESGIETEVIAIRGLSEKTNQDALLALLGSEGFRRLCRSFWFPYNVDLPSSQCSSLTRLIKSEEINSRVTTMTRELLRSKHQKSFHLRFNNWGPLSCGDDLNQTVETILEQIT